MTTRRMRIACWIPKATNKHSQYVILIADPLQQRLNERVVMLRYTYSTLHVLMKLKLVPDDGTSSHQFLNYKQSSLSAAAKKL